jgi:hypothetical protein
MKLARLQKLFEEVQIAQNEQGGFGSTTPYSMLIEEMLKDSPSDFCLTIAERAINIGRGKDGLRDRPEPAVLEPPAKRGRKPKAEAIHGATDG